MEAPAAAPKRRVTFAETSPSKPCAALRVKLPTTPLLTRPHPSAFFNAAVVAAAAGNFDAAEKEMTSGSAALLNMTEDDPLFNSRKSWRWAARARDAREKRWVHWANKERRAFREIARLRAQAAGEEGKIFTKKTSSEDEAAAAAKRAAMRAAMRAWAAKVALHEELAAIFTANPFDCDMPQPESAAPNPFDDF